MRPDGHRHIVAHVLLFRILSPGDLAAVGLRKTLLLLLLYDAAVLS